MRDAMSGALRRALRMKAFTCGVDLWSAGSRGLRPHGILPPRFLAPMLAFGEGPGVWIFQCSGFTPAILNFVANFVANSLRSWFATKFATKFRAKIWPSPKAGGGTDGAGFRGPEAPGTGRPEVHPTPVKALTQMRPLAGRAARITGEIAGIVSMMTRVGLWT